MNYNKIILCILALGTTFLIAAMNFNYVNKPKPEFEGYEKAWETVVKFENEGLPQSALEKVKEILVFAKQEKNSPQIVKAIMHQCKYMIQVQEDGNVLAIQFVEEEIMLASAPQKNILQSILAEMYWNYYQQNRWQFMERTQTSEFDNKDIRTYDIATLFEKTRNLYSASLEDAQLLKNISIEYYALILIENDPQSKLLRPTLYDFIAHRALNFFVNDESYITQPAYQFEITSEHVFAEDKIFAQTQFISQDTVSKKLFALHILQELTQLHQNDKQADALTDINLIRLQFAKQNARIESKDSMYLNALRMHDQKYKKDSSSTRYLFAIAQELNNRGSNYQPLISESHKWELKLAIEICIEAMNRFPQSMGANNCEALKNQIGFKSFSLESEKVQIPNQPFRSLVSWKNINQIYLRIVLLNDVDRKNTYLLDNSDKIIYFKKLPSVKSWTQTLPDDGDFQTHRSEIKIDGLPSGCYAILASADQEFGMGINGIEVNQIWVSNISYIKSQKDNETAEFYVLDRTTGKPIDHATIQTYTKEYDYQLRKYIKNKSKIYTSDAAGFFKLKDPLINNNHNISFSIQKGNDFLDIDNEYYFSTNREYEKQSRNTTYFFTDRSIYRPGQTIYYKGITVQFDAENKPTKILSNQKSTVIFYDVNHQKIAETQVTTNDFGSFSGSFTAPTGLLNGEMQITNGIGSTSISVEEYKRPKFYVEFEPTKGSFILNDSVSVKGQALAYAGNQINNAKITYRVVRNANFPYWYDYYWWKPFPISAEMEIAHGEMKTDGDGKFEIDFKAIADLSIDKNQKPQFNYSIYVDVTDLNGETRSGITSVSVGYISLLANLYTPEKINLDSIQKWNVSTTNLNGAFEAASGKLTVYALQSPGHTIRERIWMQPDKFILSENEYNQYFPHDLYTNENDMHEWKVIKEVAQIRFNTADTNLIEINARDWREGYYKVVFITKDNSTGEEIKKENYFTAKKTNGNFIPEKYISTVESSIVGEPGNTKVLQAASAEKIHALYVLRFKEEVIESKWIEINQEQITIPISILEKQRGGMQAEMIFVKDNQVQSMLWNIYVPWSQKDLKVSFESFRNKMEPGSKETWKIKIEGKNQEKIAAEMMASMYDASLDAFKSHNWNFIYWPSYYSYSNWSAYEAFGSAISYGHFSNWNDSQSFDYPKYAYLNWFGINFYDYNNGLQFRLKSMQGVMLDASIVSESANGMDEEEGFANKKEKTSSTNEVRESNLQNITAEKNKKSNASDGNVRTNLNETAFFYPHLETDSNGSITFSFTMPEALTRWNFMALAHTKDLKSGQMFYPVITQKDLMIVPNVPRFLREGDAIYLTAKVSNITDSVLNGMASLEIFDAVTMNPVDAQFSNLNKMIPFQVNGKQSIPLSWKITVPQNIQSIVYRVRAKAESFSDGEENALPVLTNRMLVTESLPLPIRWGETKTFSFEKLIQNKSTTLTHQNVTLEFTSNPAWYAIQALPYMMEYPYECAEQLFNRYYSNSIAGHVAHASPKIKSVFDSWKNTPDALVSNLEKNQELKSLLLEETPWVLQAQNETERKKRIALLFDLNKMSNERFVAINKLIQMQSPNGGFSWFAGMPDDRYITQYIVCGLGHLNQLGIQDVRMDDKVWNMTYKAVQYLDARMYEDYLDLEKYKTDKEKYVPSNYIVQYLYARSYFDDIEMNTEVANAKNYYLNQIKKYWLQYGLYEKGMITLCLERNKDHETAMKVIASLKQNALVKEELGMYWKDNVAGYYWYQAPIETQAMMIEAFDEVAKDYKAVEDLKVWLLKQKQTTDWKTTKATAEACYALLLRGTDLLSNDAIATIIVGGKNVSTTNTEAGTGYFKTNWNKNEITSDLGKIKVTAPTNTNRQGGISWGAMYWQYFEELDKITPSETPLQLTKKLFLQKITDRGIQIVPITENSNLKVGDLVTVRIELRSDRNMEYIHMKDMRASCFEPLNVLSGYRWQDGLGYYESTKDAATNFFIHYLPKGTYVFEYQLRVSFNGNFSNGITTIQCMYAPEFTSHSEGIRVEVK